jgi:formylmethanofuran dehydrogenase subunit E
VAKPETGPIVSLVPDLEAYFEPLGGLHRRLCPRQVLGVRMGIYAGELLGIDRRSEDRRLIAIVETDGCFADGVSVATGCWLGRRNLRLVDYGKVAVTAIDVVTERAVRLWPHSLARTRAESYAPSAQSRWHSQLIGYQRMPIAELVCAESVRMLTPIAAFIGQAGQRLNCAVCGEEVINLRQVAVGTRSLCRRCAGQPYYLESGSSTFVPTADVSHSMIVEAA